MAFLIFFLNNPTPPLLLSCSSVGAHGLGCGECQNASSSFLKNRTPQLSPHYLNLYLVLFNAIVKIVTLPCKFGKENHLSPTSNCTNTATYITGFQLHCFFHWVNNRVLLDIGLCSGRANELEDRQTYRGSVMPTNCQCRCL